tara:strand:+ start:933 stop:2093 length:1161 start_codon:yes stop_codon:yes gene_type:complete
MSYSNYEQTVVLNGYALSGVQDVNGSYGISESPIRVAGVGFIDALVESPLEGNFSISRKMVSSDPLIEYDALGNFTFDENEISGAILYDNDTKGFGFTKARLNRYSISCSVGDVPDIDVDLTVYGELGKNVLSNSTASQVNNLTIVGYNLSLNPFDGLVYFNRREGLISVDTDQSTEWNNGNLTISQLEYNLLKEESKVIVTQSGSSTIKILRLGKDAFTIITDYSQAINQVHPEIKFADQSSISVNVDDFTVDAISDFSFSRSLNLRPIYAIPKGNGSQWVAGDQAATPNLEPVQVDTQYPIETDINFTMIVDEYEIREIKDRIQAAPKSNVTIIIKDSKTNDLMNQFVGRDVRLISESINASIEGEMSISLTYKGYDTLHNPVS